MSCLQFGRSDTAESGTVRIVDPAKVLTESFLEFREPVPEYMRNLLGKLLGKFSGFSIAFLIKETHAYRAYANARGNPGRTFPEFPWIH